MTFTINQHNMTPDWYFYWHPVNYKQPWRERIKDELCWNWYINRKRIGKLIVNIRTPWFEFGRGI